VSHCWGSDLHKQLRLDSKNITDFKNGIRLKDLPRTFREAVEYAARLPRVGYIWIDSLCIKQGPEEVEDWLKQSATMDRVYVEGFLNISATAATNSDGGLFFPREPELLLEDEITLNVDGMPGANTDMAKPQGKTHRNNLQRCIILDASFWSNLVEKAPVNTRGWVLQERILAPRVLHFCHNQVAWECSEFDAAEGQPYGVPNFQLTSDGVVEESRLKALDPEADGKRLRRIRLQGLDDPDVHLQPKIYALELWRRIVEVYSQTAITNPGDKLIALSGMARSIAPKIGTSENPAKYVAGLWNVHLASQLLWKIESVFRKSDSVFEHLSTAPQTYRAPSFSWASIDVQRGHGITYAEVTDRDLLIEVDEISITPTSDTNVYGMVSSGHLFIFGKLRKACLSPKPKGRYAWTLLDREVLDVEEHSNVYLDCSARDGESILGPDAGVYVVPAAFGDRTVPQESKYMTCLILQLIQGHENGPNFRRIGLTKLSPWADVKAFSSEHGILEVYGSDVNMPHQGYDGTTGMHRIRVV
jgi:hypothetical protein